MKIVTKKSKLSPVQLFAEILLYKENGEDIAFLFISINVAFVLHVQSRCVASLGSLLIFKNIVRECLIEVTEMYERTRESHAATFFNKFENAFF